MKTHFRELDEQGYTFLEDLLSTDQIARAITALDATYGENRVSDHEPGSTDTDAAMALLEEADAVGYEVKFLYTKDSDSGVKVKDAIVASLMTPSVNAS